ncbi:hypothetical protein G167_gp52 [Burkholderia phage BcepMigl]|uniref:Uncharacterized protein n=1 Tax=Burkholderia phage BcepMigl TaxID=2886899 RepID=I6X6S0_9CAUD|nr:hypothetical protein G167_gp52 [Burkholderia phage BcepMigl]AFN39102.1 hypothetical protein BcepMigl_gp33 [Burkholderia phage BcepMigl]
MALTPEKREALMLARERIAGRKNQFICHALDFISMRHPHLEPACVSLKKYIGKQLGSPTWALGTWHEFNGFGDRGDAQRRADRLAWIDWMLDEPKEAR